jgi:hypothetical protein
MEGILMQTQKSGSADDELLLPAEVTKLMKVSLSWLAKARLTGNGPSFVKIGRCILRGKFVVGRRRTQKHARRDN